MKKLLFALMMAMFIAPAWSQSVDDIIEVERAVLKTEKKAAVAANMVFTDAEAAVFWPLYEEFSSEEYKLQTERIKIIKEYAESYSKLDDVKADELMTRNIKLKQAVAKLEMKYYKKFKKVISPSKATRFFQIDNKINALINAELALEIPLVETK